MSLRFAESGGQYHESSGVNPAGLWSSASGPIVSGAVARNGSTYAYGQGLGLTTNNLTGSGFNGMVAGVAYYITAFTNNQVIMAFNNASAGDQCDIRMNNFGQLFFTRNGTALGAGAPTLSTSSILLNTWQYIEFKASFSITGTGTCEVRVNAAVFLSLSSLTNATTTAKGFSTFFSSANIAGNAARDFYVLDTDNSSGGSSNPNNNYLGDVTVEEVYPNGAGVHSAWTQATNNGGTGSPPPFAISSVAGGNVFTRTVTATGETANTYQGYYFTTSSFTGSNGTFLCTASTTTTITLSGSSLTGSGNLAFQAITQAGIHGGIADGFATTNVGTRPNGDSTYIFDSSSGDINDFAHQAITSTGTIFGVIHSTYARDDAGSGAIMNQVCISTSTVEASSNISLNSTYTYYQDVIELDPHTSDTWTQTNYNSATFGPKHG